MKRFLALVMALMMVLCLCACNKDDPDVEPVTKDGGSTSGFDYSQYDGTYLKPYVELIAGGNYIFKVLDSNGKVNSSYTKVNGDEMFMTITDTSAIYLIKTKADGKVYIYDGYSSYFEITNEIMASNAKIKTLYDDMNDLFSKFAAIPNEFVKLVKYDKVQDAVINGVAHHEEYKNSQGLIFSFGFDEAGTLTEYAIINSSEPQDYYVAVDEVSPNEITSIFELHEEIDTSEYLKSATTTTKK